MLKLYLFADGKKEYWETWENPDGSHTVHWGELGAEGQSRTIKSSLFKKAQPAIQKEIDSLVAQGYAPIEMEDHFILIIEYAVNGMGTPDELDKRHELEERMNQLLGWTGLGLCDGGSIGSGSMEVCNFVVDFNIAKVVIEEDLKNTKFANYTAIYDENAELAG